MAKALVDKCFSCILFPSLVIMANYLVNIFLLIVKAVNSLYDNANHYQLGVSLNFTYFTIQTAAINSIRQKVRYGEDENNPEILSFWLMAEQTLFTGSDINTDDDERWQMYQAQFRLLLDVICDNLLPEHWRQLCLDNIYRPLTDLNRISQCETSKKRLRGLWLELNITSQYFHC